MGRLRVTVAVGLLALAGCAALPGEEAPEACGFPDGTALSYAGRSTTAALNVQEVVGDPMSVQPADIYITRDAFDQGDLRGRLVCAIFDDPGFVEITVHPADVGRFGEEPQPPVGAPSEPTASAGNSEADGEPYELLTHCGLEEVPITFDGQTWHAVGPGPLSDGSGNPPPGFGNPTDQGMIARTGDDSATYVSSQGVRLQLRPVEGSPPPFVCF